ncbi:MAG TPA: tryptophan synthase subunit alpha [Dissulfurispiraceae bacterium]
MTSEYGGKSNITAAFERSKARNRKAFIPYIMAGDPDLEKTKERVLLLEKCGADIIEVGVPFTDPLADGPTIQKAAGRALQAGVTMRKVISLIKELRRHTRIPLVLMTYYNLVFKYGEDAFVRDALEAGVDGLIIPDLPPEEAEGLINPTRKPSPSGRIDTIFLVAPTSTEARMKRIVSACSGFVYYVSITGITGSKLTIDEEFKAHINGIRRLTRKPVAVGFGVSTPEEARMVGQVADGVIVGSAIVKKFHEHPEGAEKFIQELREAI